MTDFCNNNHNLYTAERSPWGTTIHYNFDELSDEQCAIVAETCKNEAANSRYHAIVLGVGIALGVAALVLTALTVSTIAAVMIEELMWSGSVLSILAVPMGLMGLGALAAKFIPPVAKHAFNQMGWYMSTSRYMEHQALQAEEFASPEGIELIRAYR